MNCIIESQVLKTTADLESLTLFSFISIINHLVPLQLGTLVI